MATKRPNVLLIMTDQHRHDLMTCAGNERVPTPGIDRLAARGVRFTDAYCPYPVCLASRSSLLTGQYAHTTGAINNRDRLDWRFRTVAHHFAAAGYLTGLIGKMHFNDAHNHGFEYYLSINDWLMYLGPQARHYANEIANHPLSPHFFDTVNDDGAGFPDVSDLWSGPSPWAGNVERFDLQTMASALPAEDHLDAFIARETGKFLDRYRDQPFFLVASLMKPHTPFYAPPEFAERYPIESFELPESGEISGYPPHLRHRIERMMETDPRRRQAHGAGYLGNLAFADHCVGQIVDALEAAGLVDATIVVYTSDHGEMLGDHGLFQKFCLFDGAARVPLIVSHPGHLPEGQVSEALVEYLGLYPTLSDLAGLAPPDPAPLVPFDGAPESLDATSFAELVREPGAPGPEAVFCEHALRNQQAQYMVRTRDHKYIHNVGSLDELYDLRADPQENRNLAAETGHEALLAGLRERLFDWFDPADNRFASESLSGPMLQA